MYTVRVVDVIHTLEYALRHNCHKHRSSANAVEVKWFRLICPTTMQVIAERPLE